MNHISYDDLYELAMAIDDDKVLTQVQLNLLDHMSECDECYDEFCSISAIVAATSELGYRVLKNAPVQEVRNIKETIDDTLYYIVNFTINKIQKGYSILTEQVNKLREGFVFDAPVALATRGAGGTDEKSVWRLEEINNEKTFVLVDPEKKELYVQIEASDIKGLEPHIYILDETGTKSYISVSRIGNVFSGKIDNIPTDKFSLHIEC